MAESKLVSELDELQEFKARHPNKGMHFKNLKTFPVNFRPLRRTAGAHFELSDNKTIEAHVSEIAPGGKNKKHRHMNEAIIYIVVGRGHSIVHDDDGHEMRIDWSEGDLFSPPLNWWHQHFNDDPDKPARYLAFTNIGLMNKLGMFSKESAQE
jgi:gentisate 1,2-dioxygenase